MTSTKFSVNLTVKISQPATLTDVIVHVHNARRFLAKDSVRYLGLHQRNTELVHGLFAWFLRYRDVNAAQTLTVFKCFDPR